MSDHDESILKQFVEVLREVDVPDEITEAQLEFLVRSYVDAKYKKSMNVRERIKTTELIMDGLLDMGLVDAEFQ